jgi:hypothetical protein
VGFEGNISSKVLANRVGVSKTNVFGRVCRALELAKDKPAIIDEIFRRFENPIKPVLVKEAPRKENIIMEDEETDLLKFPVPHFRALDRGRFVGAWRIDVTRYPDSGWVNWGMYPPWSKTGGLQAGLQTLGSKGLVCTTRGTNPWMSMAPSVGRIDDHPDPVVKCQTNFSSPNSLLALW